MTEKTIVTHISPDLDAITSAWLIKKYLPGWEDPDFAFVPAGDTLNGAVVDSNTEVIHVDTGLGIYDHHQLPSRTSATKLVFDKFAEEGYLKNRDIEALERMVIYTTEIDNFGEVHFPDPNDTRYLYSLHEFIYPLRSGLSSDRELVYLVFSILDSIFFSVKNAIKAEEEIKNSLVITTKFGKTLIMETKNEAAIKYALKAGYELVIRRDPENKTIRIKTLPDPKYDLADLYQRIIKIDPKATWFLHSSKNMLLNGSSKNPDSVPSSISLKRLVEIITEM